MTAYESKQRSQCLWVSLAVVLLVATVAAILGFTFFKAKDPTVYVNSIELEGFHIGFGSPSAGPTFNLSLLVDLTVHNPNKVSFHYTDSTTMLYYYGNPVGVAPIPAGEILPQKDDFLSLLLSVEADRVLLDSHLPSDISNGILPVHTHTGLTGTVQVLKAFKHHAVTTSDCDVTVFIANATIQSFVCDHQVKL